MINSTPFGETEFWNEPSAIGGAAAAGDDDRVYPGLLRSAFGSRTPSWESFVASGAVKLVWESWLTSIDNFLGNGEIVRIRTATT